MPDAKEQELAVSISVVTPTYRRPSEIVGLVENLGEQTVLPTEIILVDGSPCDELETEQVVSAIPPGSLPFRCRYIRHDRGTAIQRNRGIEEASPCSFIAFVDDDIRLEPDFLEKIIAVFAADEDKSIGGIVGYRTNQSFDLASHKRWRWYRRLKLLKTFEAGKYDFASGYPINGNAHPRFSGVRRVDFMTTACAVWRREVFDEGLRFDPFFSDYGVLEDAHFSLRAGRRWELLQCGDAHCTEAHASAGRIDRKRIGYKCVVNYYYVFQDNVQPMTWKHRMRFWRFQLFELLRVGGSAISRRRLSDLMELRGRLEGFARVMRGNGTRAVK